jgi:hypothetical protein
MNEAVYVVVTLKRGVVDHVKAFEEQEAATKFFGEVKDTLIIDSVYSVSVHKVVVC